MISKAGLRDLKTALAIVEWYSAELRADEHPSQELGASAEAALRDLLGALDV